MKNFFAFCLGLLIISSPVETARAAKFISIGTGGVTGVYYPAGGAICKRVNQDRLHHGIRCSAVSTEGSVYNTKAILEGEMEFGVVQSDVQWKAVHGLPPFSEREHKLRALFSIHPETAILVVRKDSGITEASQIAGKRINLGNPGSGQEFTSKEVLDALGLEKSSLKLAASLRSSSQGDALRENQIDGFFYTIGHPNGGIKDIFLSTEARLLPLTGAGIDRMVARYPFYVHAETPGGLYRGVPKPVKTFALKATIVSSSEVSDEVVYQVVKAVFDDLEAFKALNPAFQHLTVKKMLEGLSAPLHNGAKKYFREKGLE